MHSALTLLSPLIPTLGLAGVVATTIGGCSAEPRYQANESDCGNGVDDDFDGDEDCMDSDCAEDVDCGDPDCERERECPDGGEDVEGVICSSAACGGDVTGRWSLVETCTEVVPLTWEECPSSEITNTDGPHVAGAVTFAADGAYASHIEVAGEVHLYAPASCLGSLTCESFQSALSDDFPGTTCVGSLEVLACECDLPIDTRADEQGSWGIDGMTLTVVARDDGDPSTDEVTESQFCVRGSALLLISDFSTIWTSQ